MPSLLPAPRDLNFFELRVPKNSETSPEAMTACFQALPFAANSLVNFVLDKQRVFSFEIVAWNQRIYFLAGVPKLYSSYFISQLIAQYPQALISQVGDFLPYFFTDNEGEKGLLNTVSFARIKMSSSFYLPLKTYRDFKDIDPLSTVLGALSKADPKDKILIQFLVTKAPGSWQSKGYKAAQKTFSTSDPNKVIPNPQKSLIEQKISQIGFSVAIRIMVAGSEKLHRQAIIQNLSGSFASTAHGEANSLTASRPFFWQRKGLFNAIMTRKPDFASRFHVLTAAELATLFHLPNQHLVNIKNIAWGGTLKGEPPEHLPIAAIMSPEEKAGTNFFARTEFKNESTVFGIKKADRRKHMYIIGKTGTGKSTLIANMAINDMRNGEGVAIVDPHGDLCDHVLDYIPKYRLNDVVYLDPNIVSTPFRMNPLEITNPEQAELVASGIVAVFHKIFAYSWGPRLEYILRNTILTLTYIPDTTLLDIPKILTNASYRQRVIEQIPDEMLKNFWIHEFNKLDERARMEAISPILNKVGQFITFPKMRAILERPKSSVSLEDIMDSGKILILNLSQGKIGEDNAALLGAMFITRIQLAAMNRVNTPEEKRRDFYLYVDEFQNFATSAFVKILSEARKYRLNLIVANQYRAQVPDDVQKAIFGNVGTLVTFLVGSEDARVLRQEFGQLYEESDLVSLNNFEIVLKLSIDNKTSEPFTALTLPLPKSKNQNRETAIRLSLERYGKADKKKPEPIPVSAVRPSPSPSEPTTSSVLPPDIYAQPEPLQPTIIPTGSTQPLSERRAQAEEALAKLGIVAKPKPTASQPDNFTHLAQKHSQSNDRSHSSSHPGMENTQQKSRYGKKKQRNRTHEKTHVNRSHHTRTNSVSKPSTKPPQSQNRPKLVVEVEE